MFIYLLIFLATLLIVQYTKKVLHWKRRGIPAPIPLPILGIGIEAFTQKLTEIHFYRERKFGKVFGLWMGNISVLVFNDAESVKTITQKEALNFLDINVLKLNTSFFKDNFMMKTGKEWKDGRNLMTPVFTTRRIKDIFPHIQRASTSFFENIDNLIEEGKQDEIDVRDLLKGYSLDVVAKFVFAIDLNSAKEKDHPLVVSVRKLITFNNSIKFFLLVLLPPKVIDFLNLDFLDAKSLGYVNKLCEFLVKQRRENKNLKYNDFLDLLIRSIDEKQLSVSQDSINAYAILFFFAGLETVSMVISNALYCLILNTECQEKLYNELIGLYPNKEIQYDHLKNSTYLDACVKESQRMHPPLNTLIRIAEKETVINGVNIEAGQMCALQVLNLHYDVDFWGKDVKVFRPERFLVEGFVTENENAIHFMPFGSGPRACPASRLGLIQVKYVLARIILNYEVYRSEHTDVPPKLMKNPSAFTYKELKLGFRKRDN